MSTTAPRVVLVHRSPHHAGPSGHARLPEHLDGAVVIDGAHSSVPYRVRKAVTPIPGSGPLYDSSSLAKELAASAACLRHPRTSGLVHYLDGERDVGPAGLLFRATAWHSMATFHTPARQLAAMGNPARLRRLDAAIALSSDQIPVLESLVGDAVVRHIPYGVDTDFFTPSSPRRMKRRALFVGHHLRDFDALVATGDALHHRFTDLEIRAVTLPAVRGMLPERPWLKVLVGLSDTELRTEYRSARILLLPLVDAAACTAVLEALACGLPPVVTGVGGMPDYVTKDCGVLTEQGSVDDLVQAAASLLVDDGGSPSMPAAARSRALTFSWPLIARRTEALYDELQHR